MDSEKCIRPNKHIWSLPLSSSLTRYTVGVDACVRAAFCASDRSIRIPYYNSPSSSAGWRPKLSPNKMLSVEMCILYILFAMIHHPTHTALPTSFVCTWKWGCWGGWVVGLFHLYAYHWKHSTTGFGRRNEFREMRKLIQLQIVRKCNCSLVLKNGEAFALPTRFMLRCCWFPLAERGWTRALWTQNKSCHHRHSHLKAVEFKRNFPRPPINSKPSRWIF